MCSNPLNPRLRRAALVAATSCIAAAAHAGQVVTDGTVGAARTLAGPNFDVTPDLGQTRGGNLFHSFNTLNLDRGDVATFSGPTSVQNVLARVTGGAASSINGTLRCSIPQANFYLVNPAGVVFGPGAELDVSGSFTVTTADVVRLADGGRFNARTPADSVLTTAAPSAFGFLTSSPAPAGVTLRGDVQTPVALFGGAGRSVSVVSGPVRIENGALLASGEGPLGRVNVVAVGSAGDVSVDGADPNASPAPAAGQQRAEVRMTDAQVNFQPVPTIPTPGGGVVIRAADLIAERANVFSQSIGGPTAPPSDIDVDLTGQLRLEESLFFAGTGDDTPGGAVRVRAAQVLLDGRGSDASTGLQTAPVLSASARGGDIEVTAADLTLRAGALIATTTLGLGDSGSIRVAADTVSLDGQGAHPGSNFGVAISAGTLVGEGAGRAGDVRVDARALSLANQSVISTDNASSRAGGGVFIRGEAVDLTGDSRVSASAVGTGDAGRVEVDAAALNISGGSVLLAATTGAGNGGAVVVRGGAISIDGAAGDATGIATSAAQTGGDPGAAAGRGGDIDITADSLTMVRGAVLSADTIGRGAGGNITVRASGDVLVDGARIGDDGVSEESSISAATVAPDGGAGGAITVEARSIALTNGGQFRTLTNSAAPGGAIRITASRDVLIGGAGPPVPAPDGGGPAPDTIAAILANTIASPAGSTGGRGGDVVINARAIGLVDGGIVSTSTHGSGDAGDVTLAARRVLMTGRNVLTPSALDLETASEAADAGDGGSVTIDARSLRILRGAAISVISSSPGDGGTVDVNARRVLIDTRGFRPDPDSGDLATFNTGIVARSELANGGAAGDVRIRADALKLSDEGEISASTAATDRAGGGIQLFAGDVDLFSSKVTAESAGDGGNIEIVARRRVYLRDSLMTARAGGDGGRITIDPPAVVLANSIIDARSGGQPVLVRIDASALLLSDSRILTNTGETFPETDVSRSFAPVRPATLDAGTRLEPECALRLDQEISSFIVTGRGGAPPEPGGWQPAMDWELSLDPSRPGN